MSKSFKQFLEEANSAKPDADETIMRNWRRRPGYEGLELDFSEPSGGRGRPNRQLHNILVPKQLRGRGVGARIMKGLTKFADNEGSSISLWQHPEPGREKDLSNFYASHGFQPLTAKTRKKSIPGVHTHLRLPQKN